MMRTWRARRAGGTRADRAGDRALDGGGRVSDADRRALAAAQARLVEALTAGAPPPDGFEAGRVALAARTLLKKRARGGGADLA